MKKVKLVDILEQHRQCGSTTWLVNAAIDNPNCIILCHDRNNVNEIKDKYFSLLKERGISRRRKHPIFASKNADLTKYGKLPIILDNGAVYE